ncbi:MAG: Ig-like domain-containing protein [Phycisphaerae bacterium]
MSTTASGSGTVTPENPPAGTASWAGNVLTLTPAAGFTGTTLVTITVSDGIVSSTQNFTWTITA